MLFCLFVASKVHLAPKKIQIDKTENKNLFEVKEKQNGMLFGNNKFRFFFSLLFFSTSSFLCCYLFVQFQCRSCSKHSFMRVWVHEWRIFHFCPGPLFFMWETKNGVLTIQKGKEWDRTFASSSKMCIHTISSFYFCSACFSFQFFFCIFPF